MGTIRSLGAILEDVEKAYDKMVISEDIIDNPKYPRNVRVKTYYETLVKSNPKMKLKAIREEVAIKFNITDKAVQKHIYKK